MSQTRFRQIARLEKLAQPYLKDGRETQKKWPMTLIKVAANAASLAFLIRYGKPKIGEPLSCAWERFTNTNVWKEYCDKWEAMELEQLREEFGDDGWEKQGEYPMQSYLNSPFDQNVELDGMYLRHELIARFSGATEKEKLKRVFASAPPWLIWFTFADYTAGLLGLPLPDLSGVKRFARSKADFANLYALPKGAFVPRPWPDGPEYEPLASTDLSLVRPATQWTDSQMTPREQKRARAIYMKFHPTKRIDDWPELTTSEFLSMPFKKRLELVHHHWDLGTADVGVANLSARC